MPSQDDYYMEIPVVYPTILQPPATTGSTAVNKVDDPNGSDHHCDYYIVNDIDCTIRSRKLASIILVDSMDGVDEASQQCAKIQYDTTSHAYGMSSLSEIIVEMNDVHVMSDNNTSHGTNGSISAAAAAAVVIATSPITDRIMAISRLYRTVTPRVVEKKKKEEEDGTSTGANTTNTTTTSAVSLPLPRTLPPKVIHVDLGQECRRCGTLPIVRVQSFLVPNDRSDDSNHIIQVVIVDAAANIMTLHFDVHTLRPIPCSATSGTLSTSDITSTSIRCFSLFSKISQSSISNKNDNDNSNYNHRITKDMISFCTRDIVIMAYHPYLLAVHLPEETMEVWSIAKCVQHMITMQQQQQQQTSPSLSVISSFFSKGAEYLLGGGTSTGAGMSGTNVTVPEKDRNPYIPVAAICSCTDTTSTRSNHQHVFTLHADGIIRHWTMALPSSDFTISIVPTSVYEITSRHVPNPSLWTSDTLFNNSISMHARVYENHAPDENEVLIPMSSATTDAKQFILMVQIQTSVPISYDAAAIPVLDDSQRPIPNESTMNLIAIDGMANRTITDILSSVTTTAMQLTSTTSSSIRLTVPENVTDLITMQLDTKCSVNDNVEEPILHTMLYSSLTGTSVICSYPKTTTISILSKDPTVWSDNDPTQTLYMDSIIRKEIERIDQLSFYTTFMESQVDQSYSTSRSTTDIEYEIDQRYMQYLFRPIHPRGNGTVLPPHPYHIYTAMKVIFPSTTIVSYSHHRDSGVMTSGTTPAKCPRIEVDVYNFIQEWRQRDRRYINSHEIVPQQKQNLLLTNGDDTVSGLEQNDDDAIEQAKTKMRFQKEDDRWRLFLQQVFQLEQVDHIPMSMMFFSSPGRSIVVNDDAQNIGCVGKCDWAMIVRPGYISSLTYNGKRQDNQQKASALDQLCYELLCDSEYAANISMLDMQVEEAIINNILNISDAVDRTIRRLPASDRILDKLADIPASDFESISQHLMELQTDDYPWYCNNLSGLGSAPIDMASIVSIDPQKQSTSRNVMDFHARLAAGALLVRSLDTIRHVAFTRYFILSKIHRTDAEKVLLLMSLHTTAVMCVAARMVPSSTMIKHIEMSLQQLTLYDHPVRRRSNVSSILNLRGISNETVSLDPLLMRLSKKMTYDLTSSSFCSIPTALVQLGIRSSLTGISKSSSTVGSHLPELNMLVMTSDEIEHPALALQLLSVRNIFEIQNDEHAEQRNVLIATCLLSVSRSKMSATEATNMVNRALRMLPYDATNPEHSMNNLRILENQIGDNHKVGMSILIDHINEAIVATEPLKGNPNADSLLTRLHVALFNVSVSMENWDAAYGASMKLASLNNRREKFHRLTRAMVNAGALSHLISLIRAKSADDLYELAAEALSDMMFHDIYTSKVVDPTIPTNYVGALYALHASLEQWKRAAQAMDVRYLNAREALRAPVNGLSTTQYSKREQIIVDDMTLAALGCWYSMEKILDPNSKYLLSHVNDKEKINTYMSMDDIALRGTRSQALKTLYDDKLGDPSFAVRAFAADSAALNLSNWSILDQLFMQGFITAGLKLAVSMDKTADSKRDGRSVLFDAVSRLVHDFLLPLALDKYQTPKRPTIHQLQSAINYMKGSSHNFNTSLVAHRSVNYSDLEQGPLRVGAMSLIEILTVKYTTDETPLAHDVATEMLSSNRVPTRLPLWLEELLLTGTNKCDLPGLFSRRRKCRTDGYLGNPTVLLTIYTSRGLVKDACRVVTRTFNDFNNSRGHLAASRLPEKGEIDFIPFDMINLLWHLVDIRLQKVHQVSARRDLESARMKMKESMDEYFRLSKITEMGQQSARYL